MPRTENSYTHGARGSPSLDPEGSPLTQHARNSSLQNLARLPGVARAKLQNLSQTKFVRYIEDNDDGSRDENDIYRQHVSERFLGAAPQRRMLHERGAGSRGRRRLSPARPCGTPPPCAGCVPSTNLPRRALPALQPGDQVFTFERWNKHRDSFRYAKHLAHMFSSRVFKQLLGPVLCVSALALAVGVYETLVAVSWASWQ